MADTKLTALTALSPILSTDLLYAVSDPGGTPASKKVTLATVKTALQAANSFDLLSSLTGAEIAVTGAVTATIGRMHVISGTSADYTITLPAVSGNTGKLIGFRVAGFAAASKVYTLDGNASEAINGALTRILWANESCLLLCDGSHWFKVPGGVSIPMTLRLTRASSAQTGIASSTWTALLMDTQDTSGNWLAPAAMWDSGNNRAKALRPGMYQANTYCYASGVAAANGYVYLGMVVSGGSQPAAIQQSAVVLGTGVAGMSGLFDMAVNDYLRPFIYGPATTTLTVVVNGTEITIHEVPQW